MQNVRIQVTAEDLRGRMTDMKDCAGFRAIKRRIPDIIEVSGCIKYFRVRGLKFWIPWHATEKLIAHFFHQTEGRGEPVQPFDFWVVVTNLVEVTGVESDED